MSSHGLYYLAETYGTSDSSDSEDDDDTNTVARKKLKLDENEQFADKVVPENQKCKPTKKCSLPVPSSVLSLYGGNSIFEHTEDKSKHDGRARSFLHEPGVWASYTYISNSNNPEIRHLIEVLCKGNGCLTPFELEKCHISLSKTVKLRHHWIAPLVQQLRLKLTPLSAVTLFLNSLEVYTNEERTRTFLGLKVHAGIEGLNAMTKAIDSCLQEYELPLFYENPSFHMSLAWCLGDSEAKLLEMLPDLQMKFDHFSQRHPKCKIIKVSHVYFKTGNKLFEFPLKSMETG